MLNAAYANKKDDLQKYDRRKKVRFWFVFCADGGANFCNYF